MSEPALPVRATGLEIEEAGDGFIVYDSIRDRVHYLNHTAALILELANGMLDRQGIAHWLARVYNLEVAPTEDVARLVGELTAEGLLEGEPGSSRDPAGDTDRPAAPNRSHEEEGPRHVAR